MSAAFTSSVESELLDLREVCALGYGHAQSIRSRIHRGEVPAVLVGNRFKIRRDDLHHLTKPAGPALTDDGGDLDALVQRIVEELPPLTASQKAELGQLLAVACQSMILTSDSRVAAR
ncbi:hypothetical protein ACLRGI_14490 [Paenarthrobacter nitroguajacolicus]|uniref:hypothetical protein n=1 Tax=Paenarthrobacter nitroguajacolicus TaxID=211146 RepID=UPI003AEC336C